MSNILSACIGDTSVNLYKIQSLDKDDELQITYSLCFRDLPTDCTATAIYIEETAACQAFASWIMSGELMIGAKLLEHLDRLHNKLGKSAVIFLR